MSEEIFILGSARTAIGTFGGSLSGVSPIELATAVSKAAIERSEVESSQIGQVAFGHVINTEPKDMYLSRVAALNANISNRAPAMNVNRLCGSGAQAIVSIFQSLKMGDADFGLAGGSENMSRSPHIIPDARWGRKMGDATVSDMMIGALTCPFGTGHMGVTAENVAEELQISRDDQDNFASESQRKALVAIKSGRFREQIIPIEVKKRRETVLFDQDEHPKETTLKTLSELPAVFKKGGTVTAGNSSGLNDGSCALLIASEAGVKTINANPLARVVCGTSVGVEPRTMGIGPVLASKKALKMAGLSMDQMDLIEINEAFSAQVLSCTRELGLEDTDPRINPNGGAISLGHPLGMTGARLALTAAKELNRSGGRYALVTMCIGVGQGFAVILERQ